MAHTFDSGLTVPQRTAARDAIRDALAELAKPEKYLAALVKLPAPIRFGTEDETILIDALSQRSPAVAVALGSREFEAGDVDARAWRGPVQVHVYCCTTHSRGLVDGRLVADVRAIADDTADPGLDIIGEHVFERLAGLELGASRGGSLRPRREEIAYIGADWTVLEQVYAVDLQTDVNPDRGTTEVVTNIHTTHTEDVAGDPATVEARSNLEEP